MKMYCSTPSEASASPTSILQRKRIRSTSPYIKCASILPERNSLRTVCRWSICIIRTTTAARVTARIRSCISSAPADGDYLVGIRDVSGAAVENYALSPDDPRAASRLPFDRVAAQPQCSGGRHDPVTVTAFRMDDFDGPISVVDRGICRPVLKRPVASSRRVRSATTLLLAPMPHAITRWRGPAANRRQARATWRDEPIPTTGSR